VRAEHSCALSYLYRHAFSSFETARGLNANDSVAIFFLARMCASGEGTKQDYVRSRTLAVAAAELGHPDAAHFLAVLYKEVRFFCCNSCL